MSILDQQDALTPEPRTETSSPVLAGEKQVLTLTRKTDTRTALTRGLAEYLSQLSIAWEGGRLSRFVQVFENWAEPEDTAHYPSAVVYSGEGGSYDASVLSPQLQLIPGTNIYVRSVAELVQPLTIELWTTDPQERMALVAMLEDALEPHEFMTGLRLTLPHYHNQRGTYEKLSVTYDDSQDNAQRRWRKAVISLTGNITQLRLVGQIPKLDVRLDVEVVAGVTLPNGQVVDLQDC